MPETKGLLWPATRRWLVGPVILFFVLQIVVSVYRAYQGSVEGGTAADQLRDSGAAYGRSLLVAQSDIPGAINIVAWVILLAFFAIWLIKLAAAHHEWRQAGK